jgi:hypothetical protein
VRIFSRVEGCFYTSPAAVHVRAQLVEGPQFNHVNICFVCVCVCMYACSHNLFVCGDCWLDLTEHTHTHVQKYVYIQVRVSNSRVWAATSVCWTRRAHSTTSRRAKATASTCPTASTAPVRSRCCRSGRVIRRTSLRMRRSMDPVCILCMCLCVCAVRLDMYSERIC